MSNNIEVKIVSGKSKKTGNAYEGIQLTIGDWSTLVFPRSRFEMEYIRQQLDEVDE